MVDGKCALVLIGVNFQIWLDMVKYECVLVGGGVNVLGHGFSVWLLVEVNAKIRVWLMTLGLCVQVLCGVFGFWWVVEDG